MPTFKYAKLVRDKIPDWHRQDGHIVKGRQLSKDELRQALIAKLREEADEIDSALSTEELIEEIGDFQQIIDDLCVTIGISKSDLVAKIAKKTGRKGGFLQGEYIETVTIPDENDEWAQYCRQSPDKYPEVKEPSHLPVFITGNENKAKFLARLLGIEIDYRKLSLDEIQSTEPKEIVEHKVRQAYEQLKRPVLVEDTCMGLDALGGLPGPFIKFFIEQEDGAERICRMADGLKSRRATVTVTFAYFDGEKLEFFQNQVYGEIPMKPGKAISGFGWDTVYIPDGYGGTIRSELDKETYDKEYSQAKPIGAVREFLNLTQ